MAWVSFVRLGADAEATRRSRRNGLTGIDDLEARIARLGGEARERVDRLFEVRAITSRTDPPATLEPWLISTFGSVDAVREQRLTRVTNRVTLDSTVFASLRSHRPIEGNGASDDVAAEIAASLGGPFCRPEEDTPADTFGRVRGRRMITGANAAQADAHHAVLVFDDHDPLAFDEALPADLFATGRAWADRARQDDPGANEYLVIWNCLWRAGGSIIHGHAQALLGRDRPHARLDRFRRDASAYRAARGSDLVADLRDAHADLDLAVRDGAVTTLAHLTPIKEREVLVVGAPGMDERDATFATAVGRAVVAFRDRLGVRSFNLVLWRRPLTDDGGMPPIVRIVDRGDPQSRPSDIGAMELFGSPIVGADPYDVIRALAAG